MAEANEIKITFAGGDQPAGGSGNTGRPAGSSQDRSNPLLDEFMSGESSTASSARRRDPTANRNYNRVTSGLANQRVQEEARAQKERDRQQKEDDERRNRVYSGLADQKVQEEAKAARAEQTEQDRRNKVLSDLASQRVREEAKTAQEEQRERDRRNRVLSGLADQRAKEEAKTAKEEDAERQKRNRVLSGLAAQRVKEEEKTAKDAKNADAEQRSKMMQAGQAVGQITGSPTMGGKVSGLANLASSGVLGEKAAAMAGGPVGGMVMAAVAIKEAAEGMIRQQYAGIREGIQGAGNAASNVFGNNYGQASSDASEGVSKGLEKAGIAGTLLAEQLRTVTAAANTFGQVVDSAAKRGKQLEGYSAGIAGASAQAEVRQMQRDIAEAQRNEGSFSSIIDSQSRLEDTTRSVMDPIKDALLSSLAEVLEPIADIAEDLKPVLKTAAQVLAFLIRLEAGYASAPLKAIAAIIKWAADTFIPDWQRKNAGDEVPDLFAELDKTLAGIRNRSAERMGEKKVDQTNKTKKPKFFGG